MAVAASLFHSPGLSRFLIEIRDLPGAGHQRSCRFAGFEPRAFQPFPNQGLDAHIAADSRLIQGPITRLGKG